MQATENSAAKTLEGIPPALQPDPSLPSTVLDWASSKTVLLRLLGLFLLLVVLWDTFEALL